MPSAGIFSYAVLVACLAPLPGAIASHSLQTRNYVRGIVKSRFLRRGISHTRCNAEAKPRKDAKVAVIGAGISGSVCAAELARRGYQVDVYEREAEVGGRAGGHSGEVELEFKRGSVPVRFDTGAQYISPKSPEFQSMIDTWAGNGILKEWKGRVATVTLPEGKTDARATIEEKSTSGERWIGSGGMGTLCAHLLKDKSIKSLTNQMVDRAEWSDTDTTWKLFAQQQQGEDSEDHLGSYDAVVVSAKQALTKGPFQGVGLFDSSELKEIEKKTWSFTACLAFEQPVPDLGFQGAIVCGSRSLGWISHQTSKTPSPIQSSAIVLAEEDNVMKDYLFYAIGTRMQEDFGTLVSSIVGDRSIQEIPMYSVHFKEWTDNLMGVNLPPGPPGVRCRVDDQKRIVACGDYLTGSKIEDAALSGKSAADAVAAMFDAN
ncbi:hypothetical protein AAMO2058_000505200 [Amorphochlora amoebiformis]